MSGCVLVLTHRAIIFKVKKVRPNGDDILRGFHWESQTYTPLCSRSWSLSPKTEPYLITSCPKTRRGAWCPANAQDGWPILEERPVLPQASDPPYTSDWGRKNESSGQPELKSKFPVSQRNFSGCLKAKRSERVEGCRSEIGCHLARVSHSTIPSTDCIYYIVYISLLRHLSSPITHIF